MDSQTSALLLHSSVDEHSTRLLQGSSGISISEDWILTHGSALDTIMNESRAISNFITDAVPGELTIVPSGLATELKFKVYRDLGVVNDDAGPNGGESRIQEHLGTVVAAWKCSLLKRTFDGFFKAWNFPKSYKYERLLRPVFLLVRVDPGDAISAVKIPMVQQALCSLLLQALRNPIRGSSVEIVSTPFGNPVFINSIARGVVSNVVGEQDCVIMTDAFAFSKCEGGPVYVIPPNCERRIIIGTVIAPMSWCRGEWVDYTFAANLAPCLLNILPVKNPDRSPITDRAHHEGANETLDKGVVEIRCGINSGTAILLDKKTGTFLTCSHIVKEAPEREILIRMYGDDKLHAWAELLYKTAYGRPYDVAVLRVNPTDIDPSLQPVRLSNSPIAKGEPVVSVGFPIFSSSRPTISSGVVSKLTDSVLLTTCCTQSGSSGGPIISRATGEMLGMTVCNALSSDRTTLYPRMSMSVPAAVLSGPLRQYLLTDNPDVLRAFTCDDPEVRKIWSLYPLLPSKM